MLFSYKKDEDLVICVNMDEPWGHYTKWNESEKEWQILDDLVYMWNLKKEKK